MNSISKKVVLIIICLVLVLPISILGCKQDVIEEENQKVVTEEEASEESTMEESAEEVDEVMNEGLDKSLAVDISNLKATSGAPLIQFDIFTEPPPRPANMDELTEEDLGYWYDTKYYWADIEPTNQPAPPADGAIGKRIICLMLGDHPYFVAQERASRMVAEEYDITYEQWSAEWSADIQSQQVDQAINEKPDLIILVPVDPNASEALSKKINDAGIPLVYAGSTKVGKTLDYCVGLAGTDDFGQMEQLSEKFAEFMNYEGGWVNLRHVQSSVCWFTRTWAPRVTLNKYEDMEFLEMAGCDLEAEKTLQVVSDWITRFGDDLKGIVAADDSATFTGAIQAFEQAGRDDIILVGAGNSKIGMDAIKSGEAHALTWQDPEITRGLNMKVAVDWMNHLGNSYYVHPVEIITIENVENFLPASW